MKKVVVLSDTHGLLRPQVLECLDGADLMVHAGDINTQAVVDQLASYGPLQVVRGNNDKDWAEQIPLSCRFTVEDVSFFMVHNKRDVPRDLAAVDVIVYGHSHKYAREEKDGVLWLNPGSCGPRRFHQEITLAILTVEGKKVEVRKVVIPHSSQPLA